MEAFPLQSRGPDPGEALGASGGVRAGSLCSTSISPTVGWCLSRQPAGLWGVSAEGFHQLTEWKSWWQCAQPHAHLILLRPHALWEWYFFHTKVNPGSHHWSLALPQTEASPFFLVLKECLDSQVLLSPMPTPLFLGISYVGWRSSNPHSNLKNPTSSLTCFRNW